MKDTPKDHLVLDELRRAGCDLSFPHRVRHYLYLPNEKQAKKVAHKLQAAGYEIEVRLGADGINWLVLINHSIVLTEQAILNVRSQLEKLALELHGEYDGWEAQTMPT
jgi:hypothetical protein